MSVYVCMCVNVYAHACMAHTCERESVCVRVELLVYGRKICSHKKILEEAAIRGRNNFGNSFVGFALSTRCFSLDYPFSMGFKSGKFA